MLLKFYRSNEPMTIMVLPFILLAIWSLYFIWAPPVVVENPMPLYQLFQWLGDFSHWISGGVAVAIIMIQAVVLNDLFNGYEFLKRNTSMAALLLILFSGIHISTLGMHPILFAMLFVLLALRRLLTIYRQTTVYSQVFDAGFFIGVAALFYFPAIYLLPFVWGTLSILRPFTWREYFIPLLGLIVPCIYGIVWLFFTDSLGVLSTLWTYEFFQYNGLFSANKWIEWTFIGLNIWFILSSIIHFAGSMKVGSIRERNIKQVYMLLAAFLVGLFALSFFNTTEPYRLGLLSLPLAVLYAFYFYSSRRQWLSSFLFYLWIALAGFNAWLVFWNT